MAYQLHNFQPHTRLAAASLNQMDTQIVKNADYLGLNGDSVQISAGVNPAVVELEEGVLLHVEAENEATTKIYVCGENVWSAGDVSVSVFKEVTLPIMYPAGTYTIIADIETDATTGYCYVTGNNNSFTATPAPKEHSTQKITAKAPFNKMSFFASNSYSASQGHKATFKNICLRMDDNTVRVPYIGTEYESSFDAETIGEKTIIISADGGAVTVTAPNGTKAPKFSKMESKINRLIDEAYTDEVTSAALEVTEGHFYTINGGSGEYSNSKRAAAIPVTEGSTIYVSGTSMTNMPCVAYFATKTANFVGYDCYNSNGKTFADEPVIVPTGAKYAVVQGTKSGAALGLKTPVTVSAFDTVNENKAGLNFGRYTEYQIGKRLEAMTKVKPFSWKTRDKALITIRVDDLRHDTDKVAKIMHEYGYPLVVAAPADNINGVPDGLSGSARIGETMTEVMRYIVSDGGEITEHSNATVTEDNYYTLLVDGKKTLEDAGFTIRGASVANSGASAELKATINPYMCLYYDYSNGYGNSAQYNAFDTNMATNFATAVDFATSLSGWVSSKQHRTIVVHTLDGSESNGMNETMFRAYLDAIKTHVDAGNLEVVTWENAFDRYGQY